MKDVTDNSKYQTFSNSKSKLTTKPDYKEKL